MSEASSTRLSKAALAAFILGASSLVLLLATALPSLFLGVQAIRSINRSDGRLRGRGLAVAGLVLSAFVTLVTLLGSIALVLLYVQERSYALGCANNLRQIGQAVHAYSKQNEDYFPPGTVINAGLKPQQRLSWEAAILPYLFESESAGKKADKKRDKGIGKIAFNEAWDAPANAGLRSNVLPFLCPVLAHELMPGKVGLTAYVGIAGVGEDAATLPRSDVNAGFFGYDRLLQAKDITALLSATAAALETRHDNGLWPAGGSPTVRGVLPEGNRYVGNDAAFGGLHRNRANILWADGSVRALSDEIDPELFRNLARIAR